MEKVKEEDLYEEPTKDYNSLNHVDTDKEHPTSRPRPPRTSYVRTLFTLADKVIPIIKSKPRSGSLRFSLGNHESDFQTPPSSPQSSENVLEENVTTVFSIQPAAVQPQLQTVQQSSPHAYAQVLPRLSSHSSLLFGRLDSDW
ncbi:hypothetical protein RUM43_004057 [Polyplax serrata]|uniref:Uncharacterized protein n=1 Tax=Polyplax serrata TaxID=468196 RepID=A0AAN8SAH2_POLSC